MAKRTARLPFAEPMVDAARRGLDDVVIGESAVSLIGGETGELHFRGYPIAGVVSHLGYEATVHLLLHGELPNRAEVGRIAAELGARRALPPETAAVIDALPRSLSPMAALRTALSSLGEPTFGYPPTEEQGLTLIARTATALARIARRRAGLTPIAPDPASGHVADFLRMVEGHAPEPRQLWALESYFDIVADHGMNASTFALRVVISTNSDLLSAATAAVGALKGPLHGGAPQKVLDMLDAVGEPGRAGEWVREALARGERLMGFGHRVYKTEDPRAILLREIAQRSASPERMALARAVEEAALGELRRAKPGQRLNTNVEFYAAVVLESAGLPRELFPPTFAAARTAGWAAHSVEQASHNRLIRPEVEYTGPAQRRFPPEYPARTPPG